MVERDWVSLAETVSKAVVASPAFYVLGVVVALSPEIRGGLQQLHFPGQALVVGLKFLGDMALDPQGLAFVLPIDTLLATITILSLRSIRHRISSLSAPSPSPLS